MKYILKYKKELKGYTIYLENSNNVEMIRIDNAQSIFDFSNNISLFISKKDYPLGSIINIMDLNKYLNYEIYE